MWQSPRLEPSNLCSLATKKGGLGVMETSIGLLGVMGSQLTKAFIEIELDGMGANGRVSGFFFADQDQLFDLDTQQNHNAPATTSDLLFKGRAKINPVLYGKG
jgi:Fe-S cluster assembly scaffold protein SufB